MIPNGKAFLALALAFSLQPSAFSAEGYVSKTATGTTSARVHFEGGKTGLQIVTADATSDKAGSVLSWHVGTLPANVAIAAASGTNVVTYASTLASNDVALLQTAAGVVTNATVFGRSASTNTILTLRGVVGTNVAVGDTVKKLLPTAFPLLTASAAADTTFYLPTVTSLAANDRIVLDRGSGFPLKSATVSSLATQAVRYIALGTPAPDSVPVDAPIYLQTSNKLVTAASVSGTNKITINQTNGIDIDTMLVMETSAYNLIVRQVTNFVSATVLELDRDLGYPLDLSNRVWLVNALIRSNEFPTLPGATALYVTTGAGSVATIIVAPTNQNPWRTTAGGSTTSNLFTATTSAAFDVAAAAGQNLYKLTNTHTTMLSAAATDYAVTLNNATNLNAGDTVIILPAAGGVFANTVDSSAVQIFNTVTFTAGIGVALGVGDQIFKASANGGVPVGAATVHLLGSAIFSAPQYAPVQLSIDGTSACAINTATANYGR